MSHSLNHSDFSRLWLKKHITYEVIWRYPITLTLSFFFRQVEKLPASVVSSFSGSCLRETDKVLQRLGPLHPTHPVQPWTVSSCHKPPALTQKKHLGIFTSPTWNVREVAMDIHFMSLTYPLCAVWFVEDGLQPHQQNHTKKRSFPQSLRGTLQARRTNRHAAWHAKMGSRRRATAQPSNTARP